MIGRNCKQRFARGEMRELRDKMNAGVRRTSSTCTQIGRSVRVFRFTDGHWQLSKNPLPLPSSLRTFMAFPDEPRQNLLNKLSSPSLPPGHSFRDFFAKQLFLGDVGRTLCPKPMFGILSQCLWYSKYPPSHIPENSQPEPSEAFRYVCTCYSRKEAKRTVRPSENHK